MTPFEGSPSVQQVRRVATVRRGGLYRLLKDRQGVQEEGGVRSVIQQIDLERRCRYGYRRITAERRRRKMQDHHRGFAPFMREDYLLTLQPKRFVLITGSNHRLEVHLKSSRRMKLTGVNQLWVADITDNRLKTEYVTSPRSSMGFHTA